MINDGILASLLVPILRQIHSHLSRSVAACRLAGAKSLLMAQWRTWKCPLRRTWFSWMKVVELEIWLSWRRRGCVEWMVPECARALWVWYASTLTFGLHAEVEKSVRTAYTAVPPPLAEEFIKFYMTLVWKRQFCCILDPATDAFSLQKCYQTRRRSFDPRRLVSDGMASPTKDSMSRESHCDVQGGSTTLGVISLRVGHSVELRFLRTRTKTTRLLGFSHTERSFCRGCLKAGVVWKVATEAIQWISVYHVQTRSKKSYVSVVISAKYLENPRLWVERDVRCEAAGPLC